MQWWSKLNLAYFDPDSKLDSYETPAQHTGDSL